jgi:nucleosome binding factor SPN SPT16 subunit
VADKSIKELIKVIRSKDNEEEVRKEDVHQIAEKELETIKGRKEQLENLVIRPNIVGKKTIGNLEIHANGLRFASQKGHKVDILF